MSYALLGLLIVLVLAQAFLMWKAAPTWRWYEMVAVIMTTILAVVFVFPVAGALKSRSEWYKKKEELDVRFEKARFENRELRNGDRNNPLSDEGVMAMSQDLAAVGLEAGRRWRGLRLSNSSFEGEAAIVLNRQLAEPVPGEEAPAEPAAAAADAPAVPLIAEGMVVYGFGEGRGPDIDVPVPVGYLGEFRVVSSTPNQITLSPTGPLIPSQQELIQTGKASSWSIYELLPLDGHTPFIAAGSVPDNDNVFGRVDDKLIATILAGAPETTREIYLRDGSRARADDPPASRWVKVEFTKPYAISVDSLEKRDALQEGFFDGSGRAADSRLLAGGTGEVKLAKGEMLLVKKEAADALRAEGVARLVDEYYLRPLNDYRFVLRHMRLRIAELENRSKILGFEKAVLQGAIEATVSMLASYQTDKLLLEQDFDQTEAERMAIQAYNEKLRVEVKETREKLVRLYSSNQSLEAELTKIQDAILSNANSLTTTGTR